MSSAHGLLIFDLDGTLVDSLPDLTAAANHVRRQFGEDHLTSAEVRVFIGNGVTALMELLLPRCGEQDRRAGLDAFMRYYGAHLLDKTRPYPGISEMLNACSEVPCAVLTNKQEGFSRTILSGLGLAKHFRLVWGADSGSARKPSPDSVRAVLARMGVPAARAMMIGDGITDVAAAHGAGVRSVAVTYGYCDRPALEALRPDYIVDDPLRLQEVLCSG